jgi:pilus assembly protein CpaB
VRLLLPDVLILATGQSVKPRDAGDAGESANASRYDTVTMQVPAADAPRLVLAQRMGALRLILRNADDNADAPLVALTQSEVFAAPRNAAPASVEVIAGGGAGPGAANVTQVAPTSTGDARPRESMADAGQPASASPTLFESAAAIAAQLQPHDTRRTSGQN